MPSPKQTENGHLGSVSASVAQSRSVLIAIDDPIVAQSVIPHGIAVAEALDADVILLRVLENAVQPGELVDPVQWHLLREQASKAIEELAERHSPHGRRIETRVEVGQPGEQICRYAREHEGILTVLCSCGTSRPSGPALGATARRVIESAAGSVLLVPPTSTATTVNYRRILILLDGSSRSESALPVAFRIAEAANAELVLVHAVPEPELTETGPIELEGSELRKNLLKRNERVARAYLERIRSRFREQRMRMKIALLSGGDSRHLLAQAIANEKADLVVVASHGHGGHLDLPVGSVASHIVEQSSVPVLLVRNPDFIGRARNVHIMRGSFRPSDRLPPAQQSYGSLAHTSRRIPSWARVGSTPH